MPVWQAASLGFGQALAGSGQQVEAIKVMEDFLNRYKKSGYVIEVNLSLSRCYAENGKKEIDNFLNKNKKSSQVTAVMVMGHSYDEIVMMGIIKESNPQETKADFEKSYKEAKLNFDKAFAAMSKVRQYARDPEMMVKADVEMAAIQVLMGDKMGALASYQRILLFSDPSNARVRPHVEEAFESSLPLFRETARFADLLEACETYLKQFPQGQFVEKARQARNEAKAKLAAGK